MRADFADLLEDFASQVIQLPGVSRTNPHIFAERKDLLAKAIQRKATEYRLSMPRATPKQPLPVLRPGFVQVGRRSVTVEVRGRRRA